MRSTLPLATALMLALGIYPQPAIRLIRAAQLPIPPAAFADRNAAVEHRPATLNHVPPVKAVDALAREPGRQQAS